MVNEDFESYGRCLVCCKRPKQLGASLTSQDRDRGIPVCRDCTRISPTTYGVYPIPWHEWESNG
jgi:hypothetical protein